MNRNCIKNKIWIEKNGLPFLGHGRILLLKKIAKTNSLNAAAKELSMSYKKAWTLVNAMNLSGSEPITIKTQGGKNGGGTVVTAYGKNLIRQFEELNAQCDRFLENQLKTYRL